MKVRLKRMFATADNRYDPRRQDIHDIPLPLDKLPSDALIVEGEYAGQLVKDARVKQAAKPVAPTVTAVKPVVPQKGASLKDDEE